MDQTNLSAARFFLVTKNPAWIGSDRIESEEIVHLLLPFDVQKRK